MVNQINQSQRTNKDEEPMVIIPKVVEQCKDECDLQDDNIDESKELKLMIVKVTEEQ